MVGHAKAVFSDEWVYPCLDTAGEAAPKPANFFVILTQVDLYPKFHT